MKKNVISTIAMLAMYNASVLADSPLLTASQTGQKKIETSFNGQIYKQDNVDDYVGQFTGNFQVTDEIRFSAQLDTTGYLEMSTGYGFNLGSVYVEPYVSYGKSDYRDIYSGGAFAGMMINDDLMLFTDISHQWRNTNTLGGELFAGDQRELLSAVGVSYDALPWLNTSYTFRHDRILDDGGWTNANDNRNSHEVTATFTQYNDIEPYVQYTRGEHRVSPGAEVLNENSFEVGLNFRF